MGDSLPPDPYKALGVSRDATAAQIKTAYRKAALRVHPDKAQDKSAAADEFHRIQQAYETLSDADKKQKYEDQLRLSQLRREVFERRGAPRSPSYNASPPTHSRGFSESVHRPSAFSSRSPFSPGSFADHAYEERRPRQRSFDEESAFSRHDPYYSKDEPTRTSSRKSDGYTASKKPAPSKSSRAEEPLRSASRTEKAAPPKTKERASTKKQRDQEVRRERTRKHAPSINSDSDSDASGPASRPPRYADLPQRRRPVDPRDSGDEYRERKYTQQESEMREYVQKARAEHSPPRADVRSPNYRAQAFGAYNPAPQEPAEPPSRRGSRDARPSLFRKSSSKAKDAPPSASRSRAASVADKKPPSSLRATHSNDRHPPGLFASFSSPSNSAKLASMAGMASREPRRSRSHSDDDEPPVMKPSGIKRADTFPARPPERANSSQQGFTGRRQSEAHIPPSIKTGRQDPRQQDDSGYSTSSPSESPHQENAPKVHVYDYPTTKKSSASERFPPTSSSERFPTTSASERFPATSASERFPATSTSERFPATSASDRFPRTSASERFPAGSGDDMDFRSPDFRSPRFQDPPATEIRSPGGRTRDDPSPHSRTPTMKQHSSYDRAPPVSRSASFNPGRESDRESAPNSRRPSISRSGSSKGKVPTLPRSATMPVPPINTKAGRDNMLFGEVTASPTDYYGSSGPESGRDRTEGRHRLSEDARARTSSSSRPSSSRTVRADDSKTRSAKKYIDSMREEKPPRSPRLRVFA